jgi:clan AA aspartic protease (TIGR02281 family)
MGRVALLAIASFFASPVLAQSVDPQQFMDELLRQKQIEMRQRFQDEQRQRQLDQQEQEHDRKECLRAGYRAPDVEQCVRDSAAWRRGFRPAQAPEIDFSAFGKTPDELAAERARSPREAPSNAPSSRVDVPLTSSGGTFEVPVEINGTITLDFTVDSGASDVIIPLDVFSTLKRTRTIGGSDILGQKTYVLADGSKAALPTFRIRSIKVGDRVLEDVSASVGPSGGPLLLGQSFLGRFKAWSIDNSGRKLVLEPK